jgi:excinuclease ABC subunit A
MHPTKLRGARTHNLQNLDLDLRPSELVALTGVSGAGKSALALDTLYAEGQRRFIESFSPYARQFLERLLRPPVDSLEPVPAGVAIDRRAPVKSSRSTVATMADLEPYLSALFTRESLPTCPDCPGEISAVWTSARASAKMVATSSGFGARTLVTYPLLATGTADYLQVRERLVQDGYRRVLVDRAVRDLDDVKPSEALAADDLAVVIDRLDPTKDEGRLSLALEEAFRRGDGRARLVPAEGETLAITRGLSCPKCARTFEPARPALFSYQSPVGACPSCKGFGRVIGIDWGKVFPDPTVSLKKGAIRPWSGSSSKQERALLVRFCEREGIPLDVPWGKLSAAHQRRIVDGDGTWSKGRFPGVKAWFAYLESRTYKMHVRVLLSRYRSYDVCGECHGRRLAQTALAYRVGGKNLAEWHEMEIADALALLAKLTPELTTAQGALIVRELGCRLGYLARVGLGYLSLDRQSRTLSGGEAQRVSLTAGLGTSLTGALFVLDEPTVGLHPSDTPPLAAAMRELAARGNTVVVIEHDLDIVKSVDRVVELGPKAGPHGGRILFDGTPAELAKHPEAPTGALLGARGREAAGSPRAVRAPSSWLRVRGANAHNLKGIDVDLPLGVIAAVTGPSGSGKSTLVRDIVYRSVARALGDWDVEPPGEHASLDGLGSLSSIVLVDQSPLGRTSRGNAATYTKAWDRIRARFAEEPLAITHGLTASDFSFNVAKGRCEACSGEGYETVEMQFLADVSLVCPVCRGQRFQPHVLAVRHRGLSVADVLTRTVDEILDLFADDRALVRALGVVRTLGLGYLPLGQPLNTLSGGEAQRLKLARALSAPSKGSLFVLDEPSAGLHGSDVAQVLSALDLLVAGGGSVLLVEHDTAMIEAADWVVDLGPGAGRHGGTVVAVGTPATLRESGVGKTAAALREAARPIVWPKAKKDKIPDEVRAPVLSVVRAREHNLREISCEIPLGKFVVVTGPSGSGKSSLAFDVVFAEGQRRFLETLTPYARQFLPMMPRADVDSVTGVPPSIALEQRTSRAGATSTVATVTEISHYLRLLFAKIGEVHCPKCDALVSALAREEVRDRLRQAAGGSSATLLALAVSARKGTYLDLFAAASRAGFSEAICDGERVSTDRPPKLRKTLEHTISLIVAEGAAIATLSDEALDRALALGNGVLGLTAKGQELVLLSTRRTCGQCGTGVEELDPRWFSFQTKQGQCAACEGTGIAGGPAAVKEGETRTCGSCRGARLAPLPRGVRLFGRRYHELMQLSVTDAHALCRDTRFQGRDHALGESARVELVRRLAFLENVGLSYLGLGRRASTLSGGEMQRLRLSAQLGAGLTGALYVLDEPTIGLHPRDTRRLIDNLRALVDLGSTVLVVEHDSDTIHAADHVFDLGPTGGQGGGFLLAEGTPAEVLQNPRSPTGQAFAAPFRRVRAPRTDVAPHLGLVGARIHNLDNVSIDVPIGRLTVVVGPSGSGKSTLVRSVLLPAVRQKLGLETAPPGSFERLVGTEPLRRALSVDQTPIGRSPRSIPATFLGLWDDIRKLYAKMPEAQIRGFSPARFSFNTGAGGRCPVCEGQGVITHEMAFLPDVVSPCDACNGLRFEPSTLEVTYLGLSIGQTLRLTVHEAIEHFAAHPKIRAPLLTLADLGVGYLQLGQGSHTLSGGEAQRLKLAAELTATTRHEPTLYVLDEPTTGLHLGDVSKLLEVLARLVDRGDTVVVIEHHPWVMAAADHVIELGPEGGAGGGRVVATGTPEEVAQEPTATGPIIAEVLGMSAEVLVPASAKKPAAQVSPTKPVTRTSTTKPAAKAPSIEAKAPSLKPPGKATAGRKSPAPAPKQPRR